jgi:hypothetical protein
MTSLLFAPLPAQKQNLTDDELACKVIHDALDRRAGRRAQATAPNS